MRKKKVLWKKLLSGFLAVTMVLGSVAPMQAGAEESGKQEEAEKTLLYFVDAGDHDVTTVSDGDEFGAWNSVTDQVFGEDPGTGKMWGIDDPGGDVSSETYPDTGVYTKYTWANEQQADDGVSKDLSFRYGRNQNESGFQELYVDYKFELQAGKTYDVEVGVGNNWGNSSPVEVYANRGESTEQHIGSSGDISKQGNAVVKGEATADEDGYLSIDVRKFDDVKGKTINLNWIRIYTSDSVQDEDLELQLKFDGTVSDTSGKDLPIAVTGNENYIEGMNGNALQLDGKTYLNLGNSASLQPSMLTAAFWVKAPESLGKDEHIIMWAKPNGNYAGEGWYLSSLSDTVPLKLSVGTSVGGGQPMEISVQDSRDQFFPVDEWVYVTVTYDSEAGEACIYRNGVAQEVTYNSKGNKINGNDTDSKYLGFNSPKYNGGFAKLAFDDFEIYSSCSNAEEVSALYHRYGGIYSDEEIVDKDVALLNPFGNTVTLVQDVTLPAAGRNGSNITWSSSREEVISSQGQVVRPDPGEEDAQVILTASVTSGDVTKTKEFTLLVPALTENQLYVSYDMTVQDGMLVDRQGRCNASLAGMNESNVITDENGEKKLNFTGNKNQYVKIPSGIIEDGDESITIEMKFNTSQMDYAWVFNLGTKDANNYVFLNPIRAGGEIAFTLKAGGKSEQSVNIGGAVKPGEDTTAAMVFSEDQTARLYLNGKLVGTTKHGYNLTDILKNGVKNPEDAIGYMGLSLYGNDPGYIGTISYFDVYNYAMSDQEVWQNYADKNLDMTDEDRIAEDQKALKLTEGELTKDFLELPKVGLNGSSILWESSNPDVIATDGTVNRPKAGEKDAEVILKAALTLGNLTKNKTFRFLVLAETDITGIEDFPLGAVDVTNDYYDQVTEKDIAFLKEFDADRLLSRFRETAGLSTQNKQPYIGWEDSYIGGHTLGHYLTACAQAYLTADKEEDRTWMKERLSYLIQELEKCQEAVGTGFLFGAKIEDRNNIEKQFDIMEGKTGGANWVPWYTMHKILAGLVDVYKFTGDETALKTASSLGDWIYNRTSKWDTATQRRVLNIEYGGMNDCLYELYKSTGKEEHAKAAHMFDEDTLFENVLAGTPNILNGKHANTTIPKFLGALNRYRALDGKTINGEKQDATNLSLYLQYAEAFWDMVIERHTYITGGNSEWEHFGADNILDAERTQCNCETCNTYNMLKMTRELFKITGNKKYSDYYENTFLNAIMSSINPETGMTTYFQPMAAGYFKVYADTNINNNQFWCCTGSGMENFTKLGDSIYFYKDHTLFVNQYLSSELTWDEKNVKLTQNTSIPETDTSEFTVSLLSGAGQAEMNLRLAVPSWVAGTPVVKVNGSDQKAETAGGYICIDRTWKDGDTVSVQLPMEVRAYTLPDNDGAYAFKYGPVVLSAELGTDDKMDLTTCGVAVSIPKTKVVGLESASPKDGKRAVLGTETIDIEDYTVDDFMENINQHLVKTVGEDGNLAFKLEGTDHDLTFSTHYLQHTQRYGIYWYFTGADSSAEDQQAVILKQKEEGRANQAKIDVIKAGYGQYENDNIHQLDDNNGAGSVGGSDEALNGMTTRYAKPGGFFTYRMIVNKEKKNYILCNLAKIDNGKTLKITAGDQVIYQEKLNYSGKDAVYEMKIEIPEDAVKKAQSITVDDTATGTQKTYDVVPLKFEGAANETSARLVEEMYISTSYSKNAYLVSLTPNVGTVEMKEDSCLITVPTETQEVGLTAKLADTYGLLYVNDILVNDSAVQKIALEGDKTVAALRVYAEDHETYQDYAVTIERKDVAEEVLVSQILTGWSQKTMLTGESILIDAKVLPENAANKSLKYQSGNEKVAVVTGNKITAAAPGTTVITVSATDGSGVKTSLSVTVKAPAPKPVPVQSISLNPTAKTVTVGESFALQAQISPGDASNKNVTFASSNTRAVTVNKNQVVAKEPGQSVVTVTAQDGSGVKASMTVTVKLAIPGKVKAVQSGAAKVKVSWSKSPKAVKYNVYRSTKAKSGYRKIKTVTSSSYTDRKVTAGKTYYYKVHAVASSGAYNSADSAAVKASLLKVPSIKVKSGKKGRVDISWKKISGASGYEIYVSADKSKGYKKKAVVKKQKTVKTSVKGLKSKKKYYVKIRAYRTVDKKKVYGSYSKIKGITIK